MINEEDWFQNFDFLFIRLFLICLPSYDDHVSWGGSVQRWWQLVTKLLKETLIEKKIALIPLGIKGSKNEESIFLFIQQLMKEKDFVAFMSQTF